ncbi:hypothetical protein [uncultured Bacteroides sp.]|uniref:hypothetical protein n=1 Tax=uncultured Bacteroides sp. TaxID=162156 RepID=UPI002AAAAA6D|nr:hypothetical protein [uncultured Bacteroides sp.]
MENEILPFGALTSGYVLIPKKLLTYNFNKRDTSLSYLEAFLTVMATVNYADNEATIGGHKMMCKRGESLLSYPSWAKLFNWTTSKTRSFFKKMVKERLIAIIPVMYGVKLIQVIDYDGLTGKRKSTKKKAAEDVCTPENYNAEKIARKDQKFYLFWDAYHRATGLEANDIGMAMIIWKRLTKDEKELAIIKIEPYCRRINNTLFYKTAVNYLKAKCFYNERL